MQTLNQLIRRSGAIAKRCVYGFILAIGLGYGLPVTHSIAKADSSVEYQVKAAFIYNFIAFTQWPENLGQTINLCVYGEDFFGSEIDKLQNKPVDRRHIRVARIDNPEKLAGCQVIFFSKSVSSNLSNLLSSLPGQPILTLADSLNAISQGVVINMKLVNEKIVFEINLGIARKSGLDISSKLLQLAAKVHQ